MKKFLIVFVICILISPTVGAMEVNVGLEPFPPLINDNKTGYTIKLLDAIEQHSDLKFNIRIMPYNRAKRELKEGKLQLIGQTPQGRESKEFYSYAQDVKWSLETYSDIYMMTPVDPDLKKIKRIEPIGTPRGNKEFFSEMFGIPIKNFYGGTIENLLRMLAKGRIKAFIFERASTMTMIKKLKIKNVYYRFYGKDIGASFAVRKDKEGNEIKKTIDETIKKLDLKKIFKGYNNFIHMPDHGVVSIN